MPHYNQHGFIEAAVMTVAHEVDHFVIVDDGSDEPNNRADIKHLFNLGTAAAINTGIDHILADGTEWLTWVSADNTYEEGWVNSLLEFANSYPAGGLDAVGAVYSAFNYCKGDQKTKMFQPWKAERLIRSEACYYGPCFLIRREVWLGAGEHRGRISHDYDHWLRVEEECDRRKLAIIGLDQALCNYNAHPDRASVKRRAEYDAPKWQAEARKRREAAKA